jgi:GNAT superfamily N-acetyltransferase
MSGVLVTTPGSMQIISLADATGELGQQAARLLVEGFPGPYGWPTLERATEEVSNVLSEGFALGAARDGVLSGWIGGLPQYDGHVCELHPLVVATEQRRRGIGRMLTLAFEREAASRGALTATLGTDDVSGMTSLAGADLYADLPRHLSEVCDLGEGHPFLFYLKLGYVVTGVLPDANGEGRPDIFMSKRIRRVAERASRDPSSPADE